MKVIKSANSVHTLSPAYKTIFKNDTSTAYMHLGHHQCVANSIAPHRHVW